MTAPGLSPRRCRARPNPYHASAADESRATAHSKRVAAAAASPWRSATNPSPEDSKPTVGKSGGSSGGTVQEAPRRRTDQYDKEATEVVLKRAARQVKDNCGAAKDDNGKAIGPWGKTSIQVQLGHNGHSKGTTVPSPYQGKPAGNSGNAAPAAPANKPN